MNTSRLRFEAEDAATQRHATRWSTLIGATGRLVVLSLAFVVALGGNSSAQTTRIWTGTSGNNEVRTAANGNWNPNTNFVNGDTAVWNGTQAGTLSLLVGAGGFGSTAGINVRFTASQTGDVMFSNTSGGLLTVRVTTGTSFIVESGAGAITLGGTSGDGVGLRLGGTGVTGTQNFAVINNSANELRFTSLSGAIAAGSSGATNQLVLGGSGAIALENFINSSVTGGLVKEGTGVVVLSGANNYFGGTTISSGTLQVGNGGGTGSLGNGGITNNAALVVSRTGTATILGSISGTGSLIQQGTGKLTLSGTNSYSGGTTVSAGHLVGTSASLQGPIANAAVVEFSQTATGTYAGTVSGTGSFVKSGTGNLVLANLQAYTGTTSIIGGRLSVNASLASLGVTVDDATLDGVGSIAGTVALLDGARIAPGDSIGALSEGATSFASGATFEYEVNSTNLGSLGTAADLLVVNGNLDISAGAILELTDLAAVVQAFPQDTTVFAMINYTGAWNGGLFTYGAETLADGSRFYVGNQGWQIDYNYQYNTASPTTIRPLNFQDSHVPESGVQTFVALVAVPEPSTLVLLAAAGLAAALRVGRRRLVPL